MIMHQEKNSRVIIPHAPRWELFLGLFVLLAGLCACQPNRDPVTFKIPTELITALPSVTPSPSATLTPSETILPVDTDTPTLSATVTETLIPSETATFTATLNETEAVIASYTITPSLTFSLTPTVTRTRYQYYTRTPTNTATATATLTPTPPYAQLRIQKPGPFSKVVSPFQIESMVHPGEDGFVRIQLIGEDSRVISSQLMNYHNDVNRRFWIAPEISFDISGAAETARLEVSALDTFGRPIDIYTLDLLLLKFGKNELTAAEIVQEPYIIRYPPTDQMVHGSVVWVSGLIRPVNSSPIKIDLLNENNEAVGSSVFQVEQPSGDLSHTPFAIEVPYKVEQATSVRVVIYQESDQRIPGIVHLSSFLLTIAP
jgi:hypothetical protein